MEIVSWMIYILICCFIAAFILAFAMGANDVANSFGTSVGSGVITLGQAVVIAAIFETLGAVLIGYKVTDTVRKGIVNISIYENGNVLMLGELSALCGSCLWLLSATFLRLPISATHSIIGSTLGFSIMAMGFKGIQWFQIIKIVSSWFISPVLAGLASGSLFIFVRHFILNAEDTIEPGLRLLPIIYGFTIFCNCLTVLWDGPHVLHLNDIPKYLVILISIIIAVIVAVLVRVFVVPWQRKKMIAIKEKDNSVLSQAEIMPNEETDKTSKQLLLLNKKDASNGLDVKQIPNDVEIAQDTEGQTVLNDPNWYQSDYGPRPRINSTTVGAIEVFNAPGTFDQKHHIAPPTDKPECTALFSFAQVLTAICASFAHGGNDVSNAIGPLVAAWDIWEEKDISGKTQPPWWILIYGGGGIAIGLLCLGRKVIQTIGSDLTHSMTPSSGFCIELGAALTVLIASKNGIPVSTTHCIVGSVICVGWIRSRHHVDFGLVRNIILAWFVTLPVTIIFSYGIMWILLTSLPVSDFNSFSNSSVIEPFANETTSLGPLVNLTSS